MVDDASFLVIARSTKRSVTLIADDLQRLSFPRRDVAATLAAELERAQAPKIEGVLARMTGSRRLKNRARRALIRSLNEHRELPSCWIIRRPPGASLAKQLRESQIITLALLFIASHVALIVAIALSWWIIGESAFKGRIDRGWFTGWVSLLIVQVPIYMLLAWCKGALMVRVGTRLKRRLLGSALHVSPDVISSDGTGKLLGRVIESEALESLSLSGGLLALMSVIELLGAALVLGTSSAAGGTRILLGVWIAAIVIVGVVYHRRASQWTELRMDMTNDLVEQIDGHRTRIAQETPRNRHRAEDRSLTVYNETSRRLDRVLAYARVGLREGWIPAALASAAPGVVTGELGGAGLAVALGGMLLGKAGIDSLTGGIASISRALIAWSQVRVLAQYSRPPSSGEGIAVDGEAAGPILRGRDITFRYHPSSAAVLESCNVDVNIGDRILLEGPSGGGKSTLVGLLAGYLRPQRGVLLCRGIDHDSLGDVTWREQVAIAPQFHSNYVFSGTFAFNLMLGGEWPASEESLRAAREICEELGLGPLLVKMPSGMNQVIGESGWQLSHGERSRLFVARTLLQGSKVVILDESLGPLDPETHDRVMSCIKRRAQALIIVSHP